MTLLIWSSILSSATALRVGGVLASRQRERANVCLSAPTSSSEEGSATPEPAKEIGRRIFCNRALNMQQIKAVGFDLDYTLAEYIPETFDVLAYDGAVRKLLAMGYPDEIASFEYDPYKYQRGLVIDKRRGNLLKLDRHKYAKVAYHGLTKLDPQERKAIYAQQYETQPSFTPPEYASVDTEFLLVDVCLFCQLVDLKDRKSKEMTQSYASIYSDVRRAVDLCHCDGEIKDPVAQDPGRYIKRSPQLARMLAQLRLGGTKVFLLTNSLYDYTEVVCKFLLGEDWLQYFDLAICGARKPGFLLDPYLPLPLFQVRTEDGSLVNIEVGSNESAKRVLRNGKVFQGGNWNHLHRLLDLRTGSDLMYVGDHMYSDILRSKRTLGWRTVLIVPELLKEIEQAQQSANLLKQISSLRAERAELDMEISDLLMKKLSLSLRSEVGDVEADAKKATEMDTELQLLREKRLAISDYLTEVIELHHTGFHPLWGQLFKAGHQNSRWAQQVQDYACLYTSHASNLAYVAPDTSFRAPSDLMPHDRIL